MFYVEMPVLQNHNHYNVFAFTTFECAQRKNKCFTKRRLKRKSEATSFQSTYTNV